MAATDADHLLRCPQTDGALQGFVVVGWEERDELLTCLFEISVDPTLRGVRHDLRLRAQDMQGFDISGNKRPDDQAFGRDCRPA